MDYNGVVRLLAKTKEAFRIRPLGADDVWNVRWRTDPTKPTYRFGGTTGCVDHAGDIHRVHVCSFQPCICVHPASKQKHGLSAPIHVILVDQDPADGGDGFDILAVAGVTTSDSGEDGDDKVPPPPCPGTPVGVPPPAPFGPGTPPSPPASSLYETPPDSPDDGTIGPVDMPSPSSPGVQPYPLSDVAAVAPAPGPAFSLAQAHNLRLLAMDVPPPTRGTLLPVPSAVPCDLREATEPPAQAACKEPTVVGPDCSDDDNVLLFRSSPVQR